MDPTIDNPLLKGLRIPGETVRLPSRGKFYKNGEIDAEDGEVHVYPMTLADEIIMRSVDKLYTGEAINEVFARCIPQIKKPSQLLAKEVDYILIQLRRISYGNEMEIKYNHGCSETSKDHTYTANISTEFLSKTREITEINPVVVVGEHKIVLAPATIQTILDIMQTNKPDQTAEESIQHQIKTVSAVIRSVTPPNGETVTDDTFIKEWIKIIPRSWVMDIIDHMRTLNDWGVETTHNSTCKDCGKPIRVEVPINPLTFFI